MHEIRPKRAGGVSYFTSGLLDKIEGLIHAFPCMSGSPDESLDALKSRLCGAFGVRNILLVKQVHGAKAMVFEGKNELDVVKFLTTKADVVLTNAPGCAAGIRTADCVPILVADPENRAVAAIHGGWRGLAGGVVDSAIKEMRKNYSSRPEKLVASIGPHIMSCCYEVGPEVSRVFEDRFGSELIRPGEKDRAFLDLNMAARSALLNAGLSEKNIDGTNMCTRCNEDLFYSYRRDGKGAGRQLSFICFDK